MNGTDGHRVGIDVVQHVDLLGHIRRAQQANVAGGLDVAVEVARREATERSATSAPG